MSKRELKRAEKEALIPYRKRLYMAAAALLAKGEERWRDAAHLALATAEGDGAQVLALSDALNRDVEETLKLARSFLAVRAPTTYMAPPPEGWGPMRDVLAEVRAEGLAHSSEEGSVTPLFILATELAHFGHLYRAGLGRGVYDLYRRSDPARLVALWEVLAHKFAALEREDPLLRRVVSK